MTKNQKLPAISEPRNSVELATVADEYAAYANQGFDAQTGEDYAVPFLGVLQPSSPLISEVPEARPGMMFNTVTKELYDGKAGVAFIPVLTQHKFVEWKPLVSGGGFVAVHPRESQFVNSVIESQEFGKYKMVKGDPASNDLIDTYYLYGLLVNDEGFIQQTIITFTSTKIKVYRAWMTTARMIQLTDSKGKRVSPPLWAHRYRLTTVSEKNAKGTFFNFQVKFDTEDGKNAANCRIVPSNPIFQEAENFYRLLKEGEVKVAYNSQASSVKEEEDDIPFK